MTHSKIYFGHCIGCDQPIRPPYLSFTVMHVHGVDGSSITQWEDVDVCTRCQDKLTATELHRLITEEDEPEPSSFHEALTGKLTDEELDQVEAVMTGRRMTSALKE